MEIDKNFTAELYSAFDAKAAWFSQEQIPRLHSEYINMQSMVGNFFQNLINKGILKDDPYKNDKRITKIQPISDEPYNDSENAKILGVRLSEYVQMLDFICSYLNFSLESLVPERLKQLSLFNSSILWNAVSLTSSSPNARGIAEAIKQILQGSDTIGSNLIKTTLSSCSQTMAKINEIIKQLASFQREAYKIDIRRNILDNPNFLDSDCETKDKMDVKIRSLFKQVYSDKNKKPLYPELINELIDETIGSNKEELREKLLSKLAIEKKEKSAKKSAKIDTHEMIMDAVHILCASDSQIMKIVEKFKENSKTLENSRMSGFQKFIRKLRSSMGLKEKPVSYKVTLTDTLSNAKRSEMVHFSEFIETLEKKARNYNILSQQDSAAHKKFEARVENEILDFVTKQLYDWQKNMQIINGLDEFFKSQTPSKDKSKIKGIKVEVMVIKNALVKANQKKSDYVSIIEEKQQMEKLGITDEF